jgi:hypothetical protein
MQQISNIYFVTKIYLFRDKVNFGYLLHLVGYFIRRCCKTFRAIDFKPSKKGCVFIIKCNKFLLQ